MANFPHSDRFSASLRAWQWTKIWATPGLIIGGAIWVGLHGLIWIIRATKSHWNSDHSVASFPSPGKKYKAVVFISMGGGPATSYCGTSVYVVPIETEDAGMVEERDLIYTA